MKKTLHAGKLIGLLCSFSTFIFAQTTFPINGAKDIRPSVYAFTNANIFTDYQTLLTNATLLIENDKIVEVGKNVTIPAHAVVYDCKNMFVYPSFIDLDTDFGLPSVKTLESNIHPQYESSQKGAFEWNQALKPEQNAALAFVNDSKKAQEFRKIGFGTVLSYFHDGIFRGTSVLVALSDQKEHFSILKSNAGFHYSFDKGLSTQEYPSSLMGSIALIRQTFYDADWYKQKKNLNQAEIHLGLETINTNRKLPQFFDAQDAKNIIRAAKIAKEFQIPMIFKGNGTEYQNLDEIKKTNSALIIPLIFPKTYDVSDLLNADLVSFEQMKHWEMSPLNPYYISVNKIPFAFTSNGLSDKNNFFPQVKRAVKYGLSHENALKALTFQPAQMVNATDIIGSLKKGFQANFLITSDSIFKKDALIYENWVQGKRFLIEKKYDQDMRGFYNFSITSDKNIYPKLKLQIPDSATISLTGTQTNIEGEILKDTNTAKIKIERQDQNINFQLEWNKNKTRFSGWFIPKQGFTGVGETSEGIKFDWKADFTMKFDETKAKNNKKDSSLVEFTTELKKIDKPIFPFQAYGFTQKTEQKSMLIKNITVWTSDSAGILPQTDVFIQKGKIAKIGKNLAFKSDLTVDGTNLHLTPGIIDEHSHIAINGGVNECSHSVTAEVRIEDILNHEDINIYRNLSGGVTSAQILHGSCNCIGGQSAIIKLRWGSSAQELLNKDAVPFIKFALGENVKQTNFGDSYTLRFPQTRMGVEQVYEDIFTRASSYSTNWLIYKLAKEPNEIPRRDLQLEAIAEILQKKRFVTCHSYVQPEILMMMRVAEKYNFRINTFTHILEGYKVADKMKAHGVAGSTFADWWAYKYEVKDAIPQNAAIMHKVGVLTAINSDDPEMARRLNQEAAKTIKYGNVSEIDALKMITINPATMLHLEKTTGSIKEGKEADLVIWSGNPLTVYAQVLQTYVDGICLYDSEKNAKMFEWIKSEKIRIAKKMLKSKENGDETQLPQQISSHIEHCGDH